MHGGGLYSLGFVAVFPTLELRMLLDDILRFQGFGDFLSEQLLQFVFRFASESIVNTVHALVWPLYVVGYHPPWGFIALGAAFVVFPHTLEGPIERWLFGEEIPNTPAAENEPTDGSRK